MQPAVPRDGAQVGRGRRRRRVLQHMPQKDTRHQSSHQPVNSEEIMIAIVILHSYLSLKIRNKRFNINTFMIKYNCDTLAIVNMHSLMPSVLGHYYN